MSDTRSGRRDDRGVSPTAGLNAATAVNNGHARKLEILISEPSTDGGRLSRQGRTVLEVLALDGPSSVAALLARVARPNVSMNVARASLSRTLRRLWGTGLVELSTGHAIRPTLTAQVGYWRERYDRARVAPEVAWAAYQQRFPTRADDFPSAAAYVAAVRGQAERPRARVRRVSLTPKGRAAVNTSPRRPTDDATGRLQHPSVAGTPADPVNNSASQVRPTC